MASGIIASGIIACIIFIIVLFVMKKEKFSSRVIYYIGGQNVNYNIPIQVTADPVYMGGGQYVYMVEDHGDTKMVEYPSNIAKYYTGPVSNFNASDWGSYNTGNYTFWWTANGVL